MNAPAGTPPHSEGGWFGPLRFGLAEMGRRLKARPLLSRIALAGLIGFVFTSPFSISVSQFFAYAAIAAWLVSMGREQELFANRAPLWLPFLVFAALTLASAFNSADPWYSLVHSRHLVQILIFFLALNVVRDDWEALWLVRALLAVTAVASAYTLLVSLRSPGIGLANRMSGFFSIYMTLGGYLLVVSSLALAYVLVPGRRTGGWIHGAAALMVAAMLTTLSRNAWVGLGVSFLVIAAAGKSRKAGLFLALAIVLALLFAPASIRQRLESFANPKDVTAVERIYMWRSGLQMVRDRPVLGFGPGMIKKNYHHYANPKAIKQYTGHLHNNLLHLAAERGLPALAAWIWVWVAFFCEGIRRLRAAREGSFALRYRVVAGLAAVAGFLAAGLFEFNFGDSEVVMVTYFAMSLPFMVSGGA